MTPLVMSGQIPDSALLIIDQKVEINLSKSRNIIWNNDFKVIAYWWVELNYRQECEDL